MNARHCPDCSQVRARCFCRFAVAFDNQPRVLILQHPSEVKHAKNTAGFLAHCFANCHIIVGEIFSETFLRDTLHSRGLTPLLLYPPTPDAESLKMTAPPALPSTIDPAQTLLVVLDATWRKSRKMLYLNRILQTLPRITIDSDAPKLYRIRKAADAIQLSTLEASCYALQTLNPAQDTAPVLAAFGAYIDHLAPFYPHAEPRPLIDEDL